MLHFLFGFLARLLSNAKKNVKLVDPIKCLSVCMSCTWDRERDCVLMDEEQVVIVIGNITLLGSAVLCRRERKRDGRRFNFLVFIVSFHAYFRFLFSIFDFLKTLLYWFIIIPQNASLYPFPVNFVRVCVHVRLGRSTEHVERWKVLYNKPKMLLGTLKFSFPLPRSYRYSSVTRLAIIINCRERKKSNVFSTIETFLLCALCVCNLGVLLSCLSLCNKVL